MSLNPNFIEAVRRLYPTANFTRDVILQDNADGRGPFLVAWNIPQTSPPTDIEIANAMAGPRPDADVTGPINAAVLKVLFNHESRLRVLEAKPAVTPAQFIAVIKTIL